MIFRPTRRGLLALALCVSAAAGVAELAVWGRRLSARDPKLQGAGSPWLGVWRHGSQPWKGLVPAAILAVLLIWVWPLLCRGLGWRRLLVASMLGTGIWMTSLASADGWSDVSQPLTTEAEYLAAVGDVGNAHDYVATFVDRLGTQPIHVQGHPPGQVLVLWSLDRVGLPGAGWATAEVLWLGAAASPLVLITIRSWAGESIARRAAVFVGLSPAVLTMATSSDAAFTGVIVAAIAAAFAAASAAQRGRTARSVLAGGAAGVGVAAALYLSYGSPVFFGPLLLPGTQLLKRRQWRPVVAAAAAVLLVVAVMTVAGFWWFDGFAATRAAYYAGIASHRPYEYFVVANLGVLAVAVGPAVLAGMSALRDRRVWLLLGTVALGVIVADLSGFSKGEVERIWLPFVPWLVVAAAPLADTNRSARWWLSTQLLVALAGQAFFRSPW